jgi:hypothetical protein
MAFHIDTKSGIENHIEPNAWRHAVMNAVTHSKAWEDHKREHRDARIVFVEDKPEEPMHKKEQKSFIPTSANTEVYKTKHFAEGVGAFCNCGGRFEAHGSNMSHVEGVKKADIHYSAPKPSYNQSEFSSKGGYNR